MIASSSLWRKAVLAACLAVLAFSWSGRAPAGVSANQVTVCPSGCNYTLPYLALQSVEANTVIRVGSGTYYDNGTSFDTDNITLLLEGVVTVHSYNLYEWVVSAPPQVFTIEGTLVLYGGIQVSSGTVEQRGNLTIIVSPNAQAYGSGVMVLNGTWNQLGYLNITVAASNYSLYGVSVWDSMVWNQRAPLFVTVSGVATQANGVDLSTNGTWNQYAAATINVGANTIGVGAGIWNQNATLTLSVADTAQGVNMYASGQWIQNGTVSMTIASNSIGVDMATSAVWYQNAPLTATATDSQFVVRMNGASWNQNAAANFTLLDTNGVVFMGVSQWAQVGSTYMNVTSDDGTQIYGILGDKDVNNGTTWNQRGSITMYVSGVDAVGIICSSAGLFQWDSAGPVSIQVQNNATGADTCSPIIIASPTPTISPTNSPTPQFIVSNATQVQSMPELRMNLTTSVMTILPKDSKGDLQESAGISLYVGGISGSSGSNATTKNGSWRQEDNNTLGAAQSFLFQCDLDFAHDNDSSTTATLGLQFYLFSNTTNVSLNGSTPVSFDVSPAYTKLTVHLRNWKWLTNDSDERAEVRLAIRPPFSSVTEVPSNRTFVRAFELFGQATDYLSGKGSVSTQLRLVEAVHLDGKLVLANTADLGGRKAVEFDLDTQTSELVLSFQRFNSSLAYDPDVGVLLTGSQGGSGSSDNTALIIGVAVAVPVAVAVVVAVIVGGVAIAYWRKKKSLGHDLSAVNFGADDSVL